MTIFFIRGQPAPVIVNVPDLLDLNLLTRKITLARVFWAFFVWALNPEPTHFQANVSRKMLAYSVLYLLNQGISVTTMNVPSVSVILTVVLTRLVTTLFYLTLTLCFLVLLINQQYMLD